MPIRDFLGPLSLLLCSLPLAAMAGCSEDPLTELVLVVDTDLSAPEEVAVIELRVQGPTAEPQTLAVPLTGAGAIALPLTLGLSPAGTRLEPVEVSVSALNSRALYVATSRVQTGFVQGERRLLHIRLLRACSGVSCTDDETCRVEASEPMCVSRVVPASTLPPYDGELPSGLDGGAGGRDGGVDAGGDGGGVDAGPPPRVVEVAAGFHTTCARIDTGRIKCWGENDKGQLGNGETNTYSLRATDVVGVGDAAALTMGAFHVCTRRATNEVLCWGGNDHGQIGDGSTTGRVSPVRATDGIHVSAGGEHTCAVKAGGEVHCWGRNNHGQIGDGTRASRSTSTRIADGPMGAIVARQVSGGEWHSCAVTTAGEVMCWGRNEHGQLGDGTTEDRLTPVRVEGLPIGDAAASVEAASESTCARLQSGAVLCWGRNDVGQLGDGTRVDMSSSPLAVALGAPASALYMPRFGWSACAIDEATSQLRCWGYNGDGQLGDGTLVNRFSPVTVSALTDVVGAALANQHTCAVSTSGTVHCWGLNEKGQLGAGTLEGHLLPVASTPW